MSGAENPRRSGSRSSADDESGVMRHQRLLQRWFPGLFSLRHAESLPIVAHWRRIFILPTAAGWFFGLSLLLMLVASLNFNNNMALLLTFWLMGLAQVILLATFFNLRQVRLTDIHADPVHAGDNAHVRLQLKAPPTEKTETPTAHRPSIQLQWAAARGRENRPNFSWPRQPVEHSQRLAVSTETGQNGRQAPVNPAGTTFVLPLPVQQRGRLAVPRLKISTSYPAGLFRAWIVAQPRHEILVYPRPEVRAPPWPLGSALAGQRWHHTSGEHFDGVRPYQYGDPLRLVAWKRSAQREDLVSREFHDSRGEKVILDWQQVAHLPLEQALSRLTAWVLRADDAGLNYRLILPEFDSRIGQGHVHRHECLRALALFRQKP